MLAINVVRPTALAVAIAMGLSGCATINDYVADNPDTSCAAAGLLGAALGLAVAVKSGASDAGKVGAAVVGGSLGCGAALLYAHRIQDLRALAKAEGLQMQVTAIEAQVQPAPGKPAERAAVGVEAQVQSTQMFASSSAQLTVDGRRQLQKLAMLLAKKEAPAAQAGKPSAPAVAVVPKKILVVGHTDATGTAEGNQRLSEQRARAVGDILADAGIARKDIYYQGAGASRPVASNTTDEGRAQNRRVEFVEVDSEQLLVQRVRSERSSAKYLAHGTALETSTPPAATAKTAPRSRPAVIAQQPPSTSAPTPAAEPAQAQKPQVLSSAGQGGIDFGGTPVTSTLSTLARNIPAKTSTFSFISPAYAAPVNACIGDMPRIEGEVKSLATGTALKEIATRDFFPGLNGNPWAQVVNGHVVTVGPVAVLRDEAQVPQPPRMSFITDLKTGKQKQTGSYNAIANTYEGETQVLYRVFAVDVKKAPVTCMDIVFDKRAGTAQAGEIYYPKQGDTYVTPFKPERR